MYKNDNSIIVAIFLCGLFPWLKSSKANIPFMFLVFKVWASTGPVPRNGYKPATNASRQLPRYRGFLNRPLPSSGFCHWHLRPPILNVTNLGAIKMSAAKQNTEKWSRKESLVLLSSAAVRVNWVQRVVCVINCCSCVTFFER